MLKILIEAGEVYDELKNEFIKIPEQELTLEHSLLSVSKWESKWKKPFLTDKGMTTEETIDYIRCMTINTPKKNVYYGVTNNIIKQVNEYIEDPMTATWFSNRNRSTNREIITSELIYYAMVSYNIPFKCEQWHLNRLLTLIRVCSEKNDPKKMSKKETYSRNRALNEARRRARNSKG